MKISVWSHKHTVLLVKLDELFPECKVLLTNHPHLFQLNCFSKTLCPANSRCMDKLAPRISFLFDCFSKCELIVCFYKWHGDSKLRAGIFWRANNKDPRVIRIGPKGWEQLKKSGLELYSVNMPSELIGVVEPKKEENNSDEQLIQISSNVNKSS